jgi:hypothetical protein
MGVVPDHLLIARLKLPLPEQGLSSLGARSDFHCAQPACPAPLLLCRSEASSLPREKWR